jgi:hypothetical protein
LALPVGKVIDDVEARPTCRYFVALLDPARLRPDPPPPVLVVYPVPVVERLKKA